MNKDVCACIVTFNPDVNRLKHNLEAIYNQVGTVIIVDNGSLNIQEIKEAFLTDYNQVVVIELKKNCGIATALNKGMEECVKRNYDFLYTLDQDSISTNSCITLLKKGFNLCENVAVVGATPYEINISHDFEAINSDVSTFVMEEKIISSGSLFRVENLKEVDGHLDRLFIDGVDFDVCYRLIEKGFKVLRAENVFLIHQIGDVVEKQLLWKKFYPKNYSEFRLYYIGRNHMYCYYKYKKNFITAKAFKKNLLKFFVLISLFEKNKFQKLKALRKGVKDSKKFFKEILNSNSEKNV